MCVCVCVRVCVCDSEQHVCAGYNAEAATPLTGGRTAQETVQETVQETRGAGSAVIGCCSARPARSFPSSVMATPLNSQDSWTLSLMHVLADTPRAATCRSLPPWLQRRQEGRVLHLLWRHWRSRSRAITGASPPAGSGAAVKSCMTHCSCSIGSPACPGLSTGEPAGRCGGGGSTRKCEDLGSNEDDCVYDVGFMWRQKLINQNVKFSHKYHYHNLIIVFIWQFFSVSLQDVWRVTIITNVI